jgi:hypothetical protein
MSFNLGRVTDCEGRLQRDFSEFARSWSAVREDWLDAKCQQFEQEHLASLGPSLSRFTAALHEFSDAVRLADRQLRDDRMTSEERT